LAQVAASGKRPRLAAFPAPVLAFARESARGEQLGLGEE
jgi:hypothetical protein